MLHYRSLHPPAHYLPPTPVPRDRNMKPLIYHTFLSCSSFPHSSETIRTIACHHVHFTTSYSNLSQRLRLSRPLIGAPTPPISSSFSNLDHFSPSPSSRPSTLLISPQPPAKWIMRSISLLHPSSHAHPVFFFTPFPPLQTSIGFTSPPSFLHHGLLTIWQEARLLVERISQRKRCQPTTLQAESRSPRPRVHRVTALFRSRIMQILIPCR